MLCLDFFFVVFLSTENFWLVIIMRLIYSNTENIFVYKYTYICNCFVSDILFKSFLMTLNFYFLPLCFLFLTSIFISFSFVCPLANFIIDDCTTLVF